MEASAKSSVAVKNKQSKPTRTKIQLKGKPKI